MNNQQLQGGCSCGRNQYEIMLPLAEEAKVTAQVLFGDSAEIRRGLGSSLPTLLRVPLVWLQSTTYAYAENERPTDIRRAFTSNSAPYMKRSFCGFCGTPLTVWSEERLEEAHFICVNLTSLERHSLSLLDSLGVLPTADQDSDDAAEATLDQPDGDSLIVTTNSTERHRMIRGEPWFEELIESGPLGSIKRRRGGQLGRDGRSIVDWEIVEIDGSEGAEAPYKRQVTRSALSDSPSDEPMNG